MNVLLKVGTIHPFLQAVVLTGVATMAIPQ
jgi:hypothetical protein